MMNRLIQLSVLVTCLVGNQSFAVSDEATDVIAGKRFYTQCTGCHVPEYHRTGPMHCGLLRRRAGSVAGFVFTAAMKNSGIIWTKEALEQFLKAPLDIVPDTSMGFAGIRSSKERVQLVAFLATLTKENPLCR